MHHRIHPRTRIMTAMALIITTQTTTRRSTTTIIWLNVKWPASMIIWFGVVKTSTFRLKTASTGPCVYWTSWAHHSRIIHGMVDHHLTRNKSSVTCWLVSTLFRVKQILPLISAMDQNNTLGCDMRHFFNDDECYPTRELERCFSMDDSSSECPSVPVLGTGTDIHTITVNGTMSTSCINGTWTPLNMTQCEPQTTVN